MPEEVSSPNEDAGTGSEAVVDGATPPVDGSAAATTTKEERQNWFIEMRGWIMVVAVQVASFTYQAGLNPPGSFSDLAKKGSSDDKKEPVPPGTDNKHTTFRCKVFFYSNTTAFLTSLAIIILLMNRSFYASLAKVIVLEIIVVLDMMGLMAAYWAGSMTVPADNDDMFALGLTALVLLVIYVFYAVQLVRHKLYVVQLVHKLWGLCCFAAAVVVRRRVPVPVPVPVPARAAATGRDDGGGGAPPVPNPLINSTQAPPQLDVGRTEELRRRDSRLVARTPRTGKLTMMSP